MLQPTKIHASKTFLRKAFVSPHFLKHIPAIFVFQPMILKKNNVLNLKHLYKRQKMAARKNKKVTLDDAEKSALISFCKENKVTYACRQKRTE